MKKFENLKIGFLMLLLLGSFVFGQEKLCRTNILDEDIILSENKLNQYQNLDFSNLWTTTNVSSVYGVIGDEYQRIHIKILSATQIKEKPNEYFVKGKSMVKDNICDCEGKIIIDKIQARKQLYSGVDEEYQGKIKNQGLLIAHYQFLENRNQNHSGSFQGTLQSKWILDELNNIKYDDSDLISDNYFNNAFIGTWKSYKNEISKSCNWGDYRVPNVNCQFDIGVAEFNVDAEKYASKGWLDVILSNKVGLEVKESTPPENYEYKEWWE